MLKRNVERTPQERRARRLRTAFLTTSAIFLVATLLALAWAGGVLANTNRPTHLAPREDYHTRIDFKLADLIGDAILRSGLSSDQSRRHLLREIEPLRHSFHEVSQLFISPEPDGHDRWLAYLPIKRRNKVFLNNLQTILRNTQILAETPQEATDQTLAYYELRKEGLLISSTPTIPVGTILPGSPDFDGVAILRAPSGMLPNYLLRQFHRLGITTTGLDQDLSIRWDRVGGEVHCQAAGPQETTLWRSAWFHPLAPALRED